MWRFERGRKAAIKKIKNMADPITKVLLWEEFDLDDEEWLIPAVDELARRAQSLTIEEGERLGIRNALRISSVREAYPCLCRQSGKPHCVNAKKCPTRAGKSGWFRQEIRRVFQL